jgi:uncharacterized RDD family membrane protein YckC
MIEPKKLWFWRRMIAVSLDFIPVSLIFVALFVMLVGGNSDKARLSGFGVSTSACAEAKPSAEVVSAGDRMMPGVVWNAAALCRVTSFGVAEDRFVRLARIEQPTKNVTTTQAVAVSVDASGNPISPFYLDWLGFLLFLAAYLAFVTSRLQATPAMRLLGIKLIGQEGERAGLKPVALRLLYACIPLLVIVAIGFGSLWLIAVKGISGWLIPADLIMSLLIGFCWWHPYSVRPTLPRAPLHDILAGTRIIRPAVDASA